MLLLTKNNSSSCNRTIEHIHSPKKTTLSSYIKVEKVELHLYVDKNAQ